MDNLDAKPFSVISELLLPNGENNIIPLLGLKIVIIDF